jgi:hypothetical protein
MCYGIADKVEVACFTLDNATQADHCVNLLVLCAPLGSEGEFKGAWDLLANNILFIYAMVKKGLVSP